jgi:membrane associated rhomboid family serine protease
MLPLRDRNPSQRIPFVVVGLLAVNILAFLYELSLGQEQLMEFMDQYAITPKYVAQALSGERNLLDGLVLPMFTSMFLHGGWMHLIGNMLYLWVFGDNVEDRLGHVGFIGFYLVAGVAAMSLQVGMTLALSESGSEALTVPNIGASGAIAGVLGLYAVTWPKARVLTLIPIFYFITFTTLPAVWLLGFWFVIQFLSGVLSIGQFAHGGVAYGAHVGGFVAGMAVGLLLNMFLSRPTTER